MGITSALAFDQILVHLFLKFVLKLMNKISFKPTSENCRLLMHCHKTKFVTLLVLNSVQALFA